MMPQHRFEPPIIGTSPAAHRLRELVLTLAGSDVSVLITGDSGVGKEVLARNLHKFSRAPTLLSFPSTVPPSLREFSKASCSDMIVARSPARCDRTRDCSNRPTTGRCSWTRSARFRRHARPSCCASCRKAKCGGWARGACGASMCACSRPPTRTWPRAWRRARFARISFIASTWSRRACPRCASAAATSSTSSCISSSGAE